LEEEAKRTKRSKKGKKVDERILGFFLPFLQILALFASSSKSELPLFNTQ
jgi:hypothetical protein